MVWGNWQVQHVAYEVSSRYKKIAIGLLAASARTANKIRLEPICIGGTLPVFLSCQKAQPDKVNSFHLV